MADRDIDKDMQALRKDVDKLGTDLGHLLTAVGDKGRRHARETRHAIGEGVDGMIDGVRSRSDRVAARVGHEVESHPLASLVAAFTVGAVVGKLFDRR